jgi:hypothetical protein
LDICTKDKGFRKNQSLDILMPLKFKDRWAMMIWDCETRKREFLIFGEIDITKDEWKAMVKVDALMIGCCRDLKIVDVETQWSRGKMPVEAWSSICELKIEVPEHARVLVMMFNMMMERTRPKDIVKSMVFRDIGDVAVLRRLRVLQLATLADDGKVKVLYPRYNAETGDGVVEEYTTATEELASGEKTAKEQDGNKKVSEGHDDVDKKSE